mmetsp:Transcript_3241/g.6968  ORF Transcript_3241/g.6968 Transcript_3241/m.6968 type:complete len:125 (-) Transcript_3241:272-646(-)
MATSTSTFLFANDSTRTRARTRSITSSRIQLFHTNLCGTTAKDTTRTGTVLVPVDWSRPQEELYQISVLLTFHRQHNKQASLRTYTNTILYFSSSSNYNTTPNDTRSRTQAKLERNATQLVVEK